MTLPRILTAVPRLTHAQLEIAKAIQTLAAPEERRQFVQQADAAVSKRNCELVKRCAVGK